MVESAPSRVGLIVALASATAYGVNIIGAKMSAAAGIAAPTVVFYRVAMMMAIIGVVLVAMRGAPKISRTAWPAMALLIITSGGMGIAYLSSVAFIPVTVAAVILYTYPVLIVLLGPVVAGTVLRPRDVMIVLTAFAGVVTMVGPSFSSLDARGLALAACAALFTTCQFFAGNRLAKESTIDKIFWVQTGVLPIAAAVALLSGGLLGPQSLLLSPDGVAIVIGGYIIGSCGLLFALSRLRASVAGLVFCLEPVVASTSSALWLGERLAPIQYAGGALVIAAIIATIFAPAQRLQAA